MNQRDSSSNAGDQAGRTRLLPNLAAGWLANAVTLVIGFVMPRLIHDSVGIVALGIWDLGWSLLNYLSMSGLGAASAITHYVARFRAAGHPDEIRTTIATGFYCQLAMALLGGAIFLGIMESLPFWSADAAEAAPDDLMLLGMLLAAAVSLALLGDVNQGVLNGYHRSGVNELLVVSSDIALAIAMIVVVMADYGIIGLAAVTLAVRCAFELVRLRVTMRLCSELTVHPSLWRRRRARELVMFATKTSVGVMQDVLMHQIARLLLFASAGPVALACYSRYATLARQISRTVARLTYVIPPMATGLVSQGQGSEIPGLGQRAGRAVLLVTLPMVLVFGVFGDEIVRLWMGAEFVTPGVAWLLAVMVLAQADRTVATQVLSGLNAHGRIALFCLASSAIVFILLLVVLTPLDPVRTAMLVAVTMLAGVFVPHLVLASRRIGVRADAYLRAVYVRPLVCNAVFLAGLLAAEQLLDAESKVAAGLVFAAVCCMLGLMYWHLAFDEVLRRRVSARLHRRTRR